MKPDAKSQLDGSCTEAVFRSRSETAKALETFDDAPVKQASKGRLHRCCNRAFGAESRHERGTGDG
jgi:hypothetical protein